jgi:hypothetical protein
LNQDPDNSETPRNSMKKPPEQGPPKTMNITNRNHQMLGCPLIHSVI